MIVFELSTGDLVFVKGLLGFFPVKAAVVIVRAGFIARSVG